MYQEPKTKKLENVEAVEKTLKLIEIMSMHSGELSVTQIAELLGCSISSANRFLQTLQNSGYVEKNKRTKRYEMSYKINMIGYLNLQRNKAIQNLIPIANAVSQKYGISVNINTITNGNAMLIYKVAKEYHKDIDFLPGQVAPAYCTSSGKAILSTYSLQQLREYLDGTVLMSYQGKSVSEEALIRELDTVRQVGYSVCDEEYVSGIFSLSFPIESKMGEVFAFTLIMPMKDRNRIISTSVLREIQNRLEQYKKQTMIL